MKLKFKLIAISIASSAAMTIIIVAILTLIASKQIRPSVAAALECETIECFSKATTDFREYNDQEKSLVNKKIQELSDKFAAKMDAQLRVEEEYVDRVVKLNKRLEQLGLIIANNPTSYEAAVAAKEFRSTCGFVTEHNTDSQEMYAIYRRYCK